MESLRGCWSRMRIGGGGVGCRARDGLVGDGIQGATVGYSKLGTEHYWSTFPTIVGDSDRGTEHRRVNQGTHYGARNLRWND